MGCIYCNENTKLKKFDIHPDGSTTDYILIDKKLHDFVEDYEGDPFTKHIIICPVCKSRWKVAIFEHRLPPDPGPWYYSITLELTITT